MKDKKTLGEQIRIQREIRGWSQMRLSLLLGKESNVVYAWEKGTNFPTINDYAKMQELFTYKFDV